MKNQAYVYCIKVLESGEFYLGSRGRNVTLGRSPQEDLWIHYRTSSKMMKTMILELGADAFHANVVKTFDDHKEAYWYEQNLIKESISNPKCLNKHFVERDSGKRVFCGLQGVPKTAEHRRKLSEANKGKHDDPALRERMIAPQRGKTLSDEHKAKLSKASRGFKHTEETKKLMSLNSSRNKSFLGRKHSDETKAKMSDRAIGRKPFLGRKHSDETKAKMRAYHEARRLQKLSTT